ncbi:60S ribosomal protein L7 [Condylostylus longicornis]|uniref:60S ribosomal protein L7 n=1 Tax=Condylostylus longicornis TaxID=2530218 RepID=UPI00244D9FF2|nr:60S ribosomal protein L7 [Condylostylus longicornis]
MSDLYAVPNKLPGKQVSILAHRKKRILHEKGAINQKRLNRIRAFKKKKRNFRRAESFIMSQIKAEKTSKRMKQVIIRKNVLKEEKTNEKLLLVVRHSGKYIHDETTNKVLATLRLTKRHHTVLLKNTQENQVLLKLVEPFVIFGYPNISTLRELIFKKGFAIIDNKKSPIQSNIVIEQNLGKHGIICLEDIIHELFTVGEKFDVVNSFLCPFLLGSPRDGFKKKVTVSFSRGGEYGNRKELVNDFVARCL